MLSVQGQTLIKWLLYYYNYTSLMTKQNNFFCIRKDTITELLGGFHVTSYQANFASHRTCDCLVGFLFACDSIGKSNKMFHYFLFSSYHITKLQPSDKNFCTEWNFKSFHEVNRKFKLFFSSNRAVQKETKRCCQIVRT